MKSFNDLKVKYLLIFEDWLSMIITLNLNKYYKPVSYI
jgi:hypothetical protein